MEDTAGGKRRREASSRSSGGKTNLDELFFKLVDNTALTAESLGSAVENLSKQNQIDILCRALGTSARGAAICENALSLASLCHEKSEDIVGKSRNSLIDKNRYLTNIRFRAVARVENQRMLRDLDLWSPAAGSEDAAESSRDECPSSRFAIDLCCHQILLLDDDQTMRGERRDSRREVLRNRLIESMTSKASVESWLSADPAVLHDVAASHFGVAATYVHVLLTTAASRLVGGVDANQREDSFAGKDTRRPRRMSPVVDLDAVASRLRLFRSEGNAVVRSFCDKALGKWSAASDAPATNTKRAAFVEMVKAA